jgi:hypothetical protein
MAEQLFTAASEAEGNEQERKEQLFNAGKEHREEKAGVPPYAAIAVGTRGAVPYPSPTNH